MSWKTITGQTELYFIRQVSSVDGWLSTSSPHCILALSGGNLVSTHCCFSGNGQTVSFFNKILSCQSWQAEKLTNCIDLKITNNGHMSFPPVCERFWFNVKWIFENIIFTSQEWREANENRYGTAIYIYIVTHFNIIHWPKSSVIVLFIINNDQVNFNLHFHKSIYLNWFLPSLSEFWKRRNEL